MGRRRNLSGRSKKYLVLQCYGRTETGCLIERTGGHRMESRETMNLQQKLIAISNEMPKLLKKHYSDEVDYDL